MVMKTLASRKVAAPFLMAAFAACTKSPTEDLPPGVNAEILATAKAMTGGWTYVMPATGDPYIVGERWFLDLEATILGPTDVSLSNAGRDGYHSVTSQQGGLHTTNSPITFEAAHVSTTSGAMSGVTMSIYNGGSWHTSGCSGVMTNSLHTMSIDCTAFGRFTFTR